MTIALGFAAGVAGCAGHRDAATTQSAHASVTQPTLTGTAEPAPAATAKPVAPGLVPPAQAASNGDDWTTFARDDARSGYQPHRLPIAKRTLASLKLRWKRSFGAEIRASPLVSRGIVYIVAGDGIVRALDARSGKSVWKTSLGGPILMTPTLVHDKLFVGTHSIPSVFAALDAANGKVLWRTPLRGCVRGAPVVANGLVFEGESCGDPGYCNNGGIRAFDERTGTIRWKRDVTAAPKNGGAQWTPVSYDGRRLFFGTGNVCTIPSPLANAIVAMSPDGRIEWSHQVANPLSDDDFGGGAMLNNGQVFVVNKNGTFYNFDASSGKLLWEKQIGFIDGYGSFGTPSTDGSIVIVSSGFRSDPTMAKGSPGGGLIAVDGNGETRWTVLTPTTVYGYVAICNGMAFAGIDSDLTALDVATGAVLWKYRADAQLYASPAIVRSGIYTADMSGNVYAFSLPGTGSKLGR